MNHSVANKKYKKYEHLLNQDPKNKLFKRKLGKYDLLCHDLDQNNEIHGGAKKSKRGRKVKGFRVMTGGGIDFATEEPAKVENENIKRKEYIAVENKKIIEQAVAKSNKKCDKVVDKSQELATLQTAYDELLKSKGEETAFKDKFSALEAKCNEEIAKLKTEVASLQKNAESYVEKLSTANTETVTGLEQIIADYNSSMKNLKDTLGIEIK